MPASLRVAYVLAALLSGLALAGLTTCVDRMGPPGPPSYASTKR